MGDIYIVERVSSLPRLLGMTTMRWWLGNDTMLLMMQYYWECNAVDDAMLLTM